MARGGRIGIALEPVAGDDSSGKGVDGLGGLQQQVHPSTCPLHQATWSYWYGRRQLGQLPFFGLGVGMGAGSGSDWTELAGVPGWIKIRGG